MEKEKLFFLFRIRATIWGFGVFFLLFPLPLIQAHELIVAKHQATTFN